jgi:hypothetical protein
MANNSKTATLNVTLKNLFFRWLDITRSFHKLNNQQQQVLALLLYYHYIYRKETTNNKILWTIVFDYDTKMKIKDELEMSDNSFQNILTNLRKKGIIVNGEISNMFIPELDLNSKNFKVIFNFNIVDNEK